MLRADLASCDEFRLGAPRRADRRVRGWGPGVAVLGWGRGVPPFRGVRGGGIVEVAGHGWRRCAERVVLLWRRRVAMVTLRRPGWRG